MQPKKISIADYRYDLPESSIAFYPLAERDASKLLVYRHGAIRETVYRDIAAELPADTLLVFNNTKVVEARIVFQKPTGGKVEIFCLEPPPEYGGMARAMAQTHSVRWKCLIGGASKWKAGQVLAKRIGEVELEARYLEKAGDTFLIGLSWQPAELSFADLLHLAGLIPLPPYIHRAPERSDYDRYQTVYARHKGSVAAPTAGLHFTEGVLASLEAKSIHSAFVTLHVGAGTFLPVKAATLDKHVMHVEFIDVERGTIVALREAVLAGRPVIPVGTTSTRTIESLYWLGKKTHLEPQMGLEDLTVQQWDAYEDDAGIPVEAALQALLDWMDKEGLARLRTNTQLLITPGYRWRLTSALITNFHQPESTLLLLVAALIGDDWRKVYDFALTRGYRFLSYGDGCLFLP